MYNFDTITNRKGTDCVKYDFAAQRGKPLDAIPLWIADMDFPAPPCVLDALHASVSHGIFGYTDTAEEYTAVLQNWFSRRFGWEIDPAWLAKTPGVVTALHIAIKGLTAPGDGVLIQQPVYPPFAGAANSTGRKLVVNPLVLCEETNQYVIDFADFEQKIVQENVKMFILCNPHNPVGRVWTVEELTQMGDICVKHGVIVIADEIHQDLIYNGHMHHVFAKLKPEFADITITCTAPSKTFNIAGLHIANNFISNPNLHKAFMQEYTASGLSQGSQLGIVACQAAYRHGEPWMEELKKYLQSNMEFMQNYIATQIPQINMIRPQGTYLVWLDCRKLNLSPEELNDFITHKAKLWLVDGPAFGIGGTGFQRVNIACPREVLQAALDRLKSAVYS